MDFAGVRAIEIDEGEAVRLAINGVNVWRLNVWDEVWEKGGIDDNGQNQSSSTRIRSKNHIEVDAAKTYRVNIGDPTAYGSNLQFFIYFYGTTQSFISFAAFKPNSTFRVPANCETIRFRLAGGDEQKYNGDIAIYDVTDAVVPGVFEGGYYNANGFWVANNTYAGFKTPKSL